MGYQPRDDRRQIVLGDIGCDLDQYWSRERPGGNACRTCGHHATQQVIERGGSLQVAQSWCVGRRDIDHEVAGEIIECLNARDIIGGLIGRILVGADIDADETAA